jgi:DNA-binding phage protein
VTAEWPELESDVDFEAFLNTVTPKEALADLTATFSAPEKKQAKFLAARSQVVQRSRNVQQVSTAVLMARIMAHGA